MSTLLDAPAAPADSVPVELPAAEVVGNSATPDPHEIAHWRFVGWFGATLVAMLVAVGGFNAWVDSTGTLGTGLVDPLAELPRDRKAKAELIERAGTPTMVVLGSSRSKRLDPRWLDPDVETAVNAAAVASDMFEQRVMAKWLAQRARAADTPFPHIVMGVDVEQWRHSSLHESGLLGVPQLAELAERESRHDSIVSIAPKLGDLLFTWSATRSSVESLRSRNDERQEAAEASENEESSTLTRDVDEFNEWGLLEEDTHWKTKKGRRALQRNLPDNMRVATGEYADRYRGSGSEIEQDAVDDFDALVTAANEAGDTPAIFLSPMHPTMAKALAREGRTARRAEVLELLHSYAADGRIDFVDCSGCLSRNADNWTDGVHMSPHGAHALASVLRARLPMTSAE